MVSPEEELLVLRQFLRFGETRPIVELMMLQCLDGDEQNSGPEAKAAVRNNQSNNKKNEGTQRDSRLVSQYNPVQLSKNVLGGPSMLFPFHFPHSDVPSLLPSTAVRLHFLQVLYTTSVLWLALSLSLSLSLSLFLSLSLSIKLSLSCIFIFNQTIFCFYCCDQTNKFL